MRRTSERVNLEKDIKPVSEFRANAAGLIDQVRSSGRPEIELLRDVREAEDQIAAGAELSNGHAKAELRRRLIK